MSKIRRQIPLSLENLEGRDLLSASVNLSAAGVLSVAADNQGDYLIVQNVAPATVEVFDAINNKAFDFSSAAVKSLTFQGGSGSKGDYFANLTAVPSTQQAGNNKGVNYLQGGTGNDTLKASPNGDAKSYLTDPAGSNTIQGGPGFANIFLGTGTENVTLGTGYTALYSILAKNTIKGSTTGGDDDDGKGYLIVNNGSQITNSKGYDIVTFFQPGVSGTAPGVPNGPSAVLQKDVNGNGILYLNAANGQTSTSFTVNQTGGGDDDGEDGGDKITVTYTDPRNGTKTFTFNHDAVKWIASFGPAGSNNTIINNTDINDVLYGGLPPGNHTIVGGKGAISVLKGHSGTNTITARAAYIDVTAGNGTDTVNIQRGGDHGDDAPNAPDVIRTNAKAVSTTITGFKHGDLVTGVPKSINGTSDPNDMDTVADNQDYAFWASFLRKRNSI